MANPFFLAERKEKCLVLLGLVLGVCESAADPVATVIIGKMFKNIQDVGLHKISLAEFQQLAQQWTYCLVGVTFYSAIFNALGYFVWTYNGYSIGHKARKRLFRVVTVNSLPWFDENNNLSGATAAHFKDIQDLEVATGIASYEIIVMTINCFAQIGVAFYYSWAVTLICLAGIPVLVIGCSLLSPHITKFILESKKAQEDTGNRLEWLLGSLETVRIFQRDRYEWLKTFSLIQKQCKVNMKYWLFFRLQEGFSRTIVLLVFLQGFYFGSYMVKSHGLSAGNVVTVFWSCLNAASLVQTVVGHLIEWNKGKASAERLANAFVLDETEVTHNAIGIMPGSGYTVNQDLYPLEMMIWDVTFRKNPSNQSFKSGSRNSPKTAPRHIVLDEVVFSYTSRRNLVLRGLCMDFKAGETTFVLGHSGSGKSTIAALLSKQYPYIAGRIEIDGHSIEMLSAQWVKENVHICEQSSQLFDIPIFDNITLDSKFDIDRMQDALLASRAEFVYHLPEKGLTSGSYPLSGGQVQRISLARARYLDAPITIFDEATSALDSRTQDEVFQNILKYRINKTTIVITHNPALIPSGYPVYIMDDGFATKYADITQAKELETQYAFDEEQDPYNSAQSPEVSDEPWDDISLGGDVSLHKEKKTEESRPEKRRFYLKITLKSMPSRFSLFVGFVFSLLHAGVNPVFSFVFSKLVMGVISPGTNVTLWAMLVLMCSILDGTFSFGKVMLNIAAEKWLLRVKGEILDRILHFPGSRISNEDVSYYVKLLVSDAEKTADVVTLYWPAIASMLVIGVTGFVWAMAVGWKLSLVGISLLPLFVAMNQGYKWLVKRWTGEREKRRGNVIRLLADLTSAKGYRTMKTQHLEYYFKRIFMGREANVQKLLPSMILQIGSAYGLLRCVPYALESLLLWYGMHLIGQGFATESVITVFTLLMFTVVTIDQLSGSIGSVGPGFEAFPRLLSAFTGQDKLTVDYDRATLVTSSRHDSFRSEFSCEIKSEESEKSSIMTIARPLWREIEFRDVRVRFANGERALGGFSCVITNGEAVAIVGPSGIGKSTIGRILEMTEPNYSGHVIIDQHFELRHIAINDIRANVCLVSQMPLDFFDGTIEENLAYALDENDDDNLMERVVEACKVSGIHEFIDGLADKYETKMAHGGLLSGGQMQRLGIARALLRNPKVLILDECTSALDPTSKHLVVDTIERLKSRRDMIIIMISHQMEVASVADRIITVA